MLACDLHMAAPPTRYAPTFPQNHFKFLIPGVGWKIILLGCCIIMTEEKECYQDKTQAAYPVFQRESESESHSVISDPFGPHGLYSLEFSRPEYWSG